MELQKARDWVDFVLKAMSILAIIGAGGWAIYQFKITDTDASNIQLVVSTEVIKYQGDNRLLLIHVRPKNIGKVRVSPKRLTLTVSDLPIDIKPSVIDLTKLSEKYKTDILDRFKDGYDIEPGVEYDDIVAMIVPKNTMYSVYSEMEFKEGDEVDHTAIARVE
ncbi:MAG: hypothetical protein HY016_09140 [Nitrosomonadales bacterium]|nr:hypothetical protein [Nitrosomonadales bacterium]